MASPGLSSEVVDGVHRFPRTGIKVLVVGAGVGGLMAGLECWRKGHDVVILERAAQMSSLGDCFTIGPSGLVSLGSYPKMHAKYNEKIYNSPVSWWTTSGRKLLEEEPEWQVTPKHASSGHQKIVSFQKSRAEFARMQLDQVERLGISIFWERKATYYEEDVLSGEARVTTESGETFSGDVVIAADGINTKSHAAVTGIQPSVHSSGYAISRVSFPTSAIQPGSKAASLIPAANERPQFQVYLSDERHLILMLNHDWVGFAFTHPDKDGNAAESWSNYISKEKMVELLTEDGNHWDPAVIDFMKQVPESAKIVDWRLNWRNPQPQWTSPGGRILQIGDAAHAFVPTAGNGAVQALEDGLSVAECLRLGGKDGIPWSTKVHELLRFERTAAIQKMGFVNRERLHHNREAVENAATGDDARKYISTIHHAGPIVWDHNPETYSTDNYRAALEHLHYGKHFRNTNVPGDEKYVPWTIDDVVKSEEKIREASSQSAVGLSTAPVVTAEV